MAKKFQQEMGIGRGAKPIDAEHKHDCDKCNASGHCPAETYYRYMSTHPEDIPVIDKAIREVADSDWMSAVLSLAVNVGRKEGGGAASAILAAEGIHLGWALAKGAKFIPVKHRLDAADMFSSIRGVEVEKTPFGLVVKPSEGADLDSLADVIKSLQDGGMLR